MTKRRWIELLHAAGMDNTEMQQWHIAFEAGSPHDHQAFLKSLGIKQNEIEQIRAWSQKGMAD
jgi:hypothetical protein